MIMRSALIFLFMVLLAVLLAGAKEPQAGDHVIVSVGDGVNYEGNITYIGNGLMCFDNASMTVVENNTVLQDNITDFCISIAKILLLKFK
jgi:hypothetical protein